MFSSYLCGGDCIDDVMDIKPFWDNREDIRVCSSDVILRTLRNLSGDSVTFEGGRHYGVTSFQFYSMLPEMRLRLVVKRSQSRRDQADKDAARNLTGVAAALETIEKAAFWTVLPPLPAHGKTCGRAATGFDVREGSVDRKVQMKERCSLRNYVIKTFEKPACRTPLSTDRTNQITIKSTSLLQMVIWHHRSSDTDVPYSCAYRFPYPSYFLKCTSIRYP